MPLNSFNPQQVIAKINELEAAIIAMKLTPGAGINITRTQSGYLISAAGATSATQPTYTGIFKVTLESGKLMIRDGSNPTSENAGFLYFNQKYHDAPIGEVTAAAGYLCVYCNSKGTIGYSLQARIMDMPILDNTAEDDTTHFPIAEIGGSNGAYTVRQILRYSPPIMTAWGPCDEVTT